MSNSVVELTSLSVGELLGDGGEGEVFEIQNQTDNVLKIFKDVVRPELNELGLQQTIDLLSTMAMSDQVFVRERSVWPHTLVQDKGMFVGFVMPLLSGEYFCRHGQLGNPLDGMSDWNKLTFRRAWISNPNLESDCPALWFPEGTATDSLDDLQKESRQTLLRLLLDLAELFEVLHRYKIVVGDVSGRNILWSSASGDKVMLIDCDGCRRESSVGVTRAKQSPDWFDPTLESRDPTTIDSDLFKLATALYRGYFADGIGTPAKNPIPLSDSVDEEFQFMALRGVGPSNRPTASEWVSFLHRVISVGEFAGRPVINDWRTPPPGEYVSTPSQSVPVEPTRPNIQI
jgi:hypothetical protein